MTKFRQLIKALLQYEASGQRFRAFVGFDGYEDKIQKVVQAKQGSEPIFFENITHFSHHLAALAGRSGQIELLTQETKLGGNAPIMANALGSLGFKNHCVGTMGFPEIAPVFRNMHPNCTAISIAAPAETNALEFEDGKLIFSEVSTFEKLTWQYVREKTGFVNLCHYITESEVVAFVDWANLSHCSEIWEGILQDIVAPSGTKHQHFFFDLADPSKRPTEEIMKAFEVISAFSDYGNVTLGMNENEAHKVANSLGYDTQGIDLQITGRNILHHLTINQLLIHPTDRSIICTTETTVVLSGRLIAKPKILTGGGDNLNAGFCLGLALNLDIELCMLLGMTNSGAYIQNGYSPEIQDLVKYLEIWEGENDGL
jgi:hypothetical protein